MSQPIAAQQTENEKRAGGHHSNKQMLVKHHRANWCLETARCVQNIIKKNLPEALLTMPLAAAVALAAVELYLTPRTVVLVAERRVERNILDVTMGITTKNGV